MADGVSRDRSRDRVFAPINIGIADQLQSEAECGHNNDDPDTLEELVLCGGYVDKSMDCRGLKELLEYVHCRLRQRRHWAEGTNPNNVMGLPRQLNIVLFGCQGWVIRAHFSGIIPWVHYTSYDVGQYSWVHSKLLQVYTQLDWTNSSRLQPNTFSLNLINGVN